MLALLANRHASAADMTARDVTELLFKVTPDVRVDLEGRDLSGLDLSGLDFKGARLTRSRFFRSDLTGANLSHTDLSHAVLDRATIVGADFSDANLTEALVRLPTLSAVRASTQRPRHASTAPIFPAPALWHASTAPIFAARP